MKRIIAAIAFALAFPVWSQTPVAIVWPFNIGSTQANYLRAMIEDANSRQTRYQFVLEHRPGAGGSVAMNHMLRQDKLTLVANTATQFVRPKFFPDTSYDIEQFLPVIMQGHEQPLAVVSQRYRNMAELRQQKRLTISMINGSIVQVVAEAVQRALPGVEITFVPYNGTPEAVNDVLSGQIDLAIDFPADLQQWLEAKRLHVIGITGRRDFVWGTSFTTQRIAGFENIQSFYAIVSRRDLDPVIRQELHAILRVSNMHPKVRALHERDIVQTVDADLSQTTRIWYNYRQTWDTLIGRR